METFDISLLTYFQIEDLTKDLKGHTYKYRVKPKDNYQYNKKI